MSHIEAPAQRLVITMEGGLIQDIICDGIDLTGLTVIVIDYDTDGAEDDEVFSVCGENAYFSPRDIEAASDEFSSEVRRAYGAWALT